MSFLTIQAFEKYVYSTEINGFAWKLIYMLGVRFFYGYFIAFVWEIK